MSVTAKTTRKKTACLVAALLTLWGCGETPAAKSPTPGLSDPLVTPPGAPDLSLSGPPPLPSVIVAELASPDRRVLFARNGDHGLLVARSQGKFVSGPIRVDADRAVPDDEPTMREIAPAPEEEDLTALAPRGKGFLFAWSSNGVSAVQLDRDGKPEGEPRRIAQPKDVVSWIDVVGDFVVWQEGAPTSRVFVRRWPDGEAILAADGARGWHATPTSEGIAVTWVDGEPGKVRAVSIGRARATPVELGTGALADAYIASTAGGEIVAWTDVTHAEPHVRYAVFRGDKLLRAGAEAVPPIGGQALVSLVASTDKKRALLAWEQELAGASPRRVHLGIFEGALEPTDRGATLAFHAGEGTPHVVADGAGFAALTLAPMTTHADHQADEAHTVGPVFVRFAGDLSVRNAEPVRVAPFAATAGVPSSVYGLSCSADRCTALAIGDPKPPVVVLATLPVRQSPWRAPVTSAAPGAARAQAIKTVTETSTRIADLDAVRLHDGRVLVAWVTHVAGEAGPSAAAATLAYRIVDGDALGPVRTLSERAIALGGLRIAALPAPKTPRDPVAAIAWSGPNNDTPQVYLSAIDGDGDKTTQRTLTQHRRTPKGAVPVEIFDVDLVYADDGLVIVWSDTRDGNPELYAARADLRMTRRGPETRLTKTDGPSLEPRLAVEKGSGLLTWTDAAEAKADVWVGRLDLARLELAGAEKIAAGEGHARTPQWGGGVLSWITESDGGSELRMVSTDGAGRATSAVRAARLPNGQTTSAALRCDGDRCRGVITARRDGLLVLGAFETPREHGAPITVSELGELAGGTLQDLALTTTSSAVDHVFFHRDDARGVVRRIAIGWP
jgi:hypothetical protein